MLKSYKLGSDLVYTRHLLNLNELFRRINLGTCPTLCRHWLWYDVNEATGISCDLQVDCAIHSCGSGSMIWSFNSDLHFDECIAIQGNKINMHKFLGLYWQYKWELYTFQDILQIFIQVLSSSHMYFRNFFLLENSSKLTFCSKYV